MSKNITHGKSARDAVMRGVDFLADAVKITEGPRGRNIILGQRALGQSPKCTRDGVTVCNYVDPADPTEQMGTDLVREAAQKTDNAVGDGTTASIVLSQAMIHHGFELIDRGSNPMAMERGMHKATDVVIAHLRAMAQEVTPEKVFQVATVSAHGDETIGRLVSDAVAKAGRDGVLTVEPSSTSDTYMETAVGLELQKSNLISPVFVTHPSQLKAELVDCRILLWEGVIATGKSVIPLLKQVNGGEPQPGQQPQQVPLLIVAGGYEAEALACIIKNRAQLGLPLIAVRMEAYGERRKEVMRDIAALTGGKAFTEDMGTKIENVKVSELGMARKVVTDMSKTQIIGGRGNQQDLAGRVTFIREAMSQVSPGEAAILKQRLAALLGGITIIKVGGVTVTEMEEKKDRVVDAMSAAKAAVESGVVPGGGVALLRASVVLGAMKLLPDEQPGLDVVYHACFSIARQIAENAGIVGDNLVRHMGALTATPQLGYNAMTGVFEDLVKSGIIDPVKVVCESLKNATAVSCSILTMGATVSEVLEKTNV